MLAPYLVLSCALFTFSNAYSEMVSWVPSNHFPTNGNGTAVANVAPKTKPTLHYFDDHNPSRSSFTFTLSHDDKDYVMLEDLEGSVKVECEKSNDPNATYSVNVSFNKDYKTDHLFQQAQQHWDRDDLLFVAHEPSCGPANLDERQIFKPISTVFNTENRTFKMEALLVDLGTPDSASVVSIRYGSLPGQNVPRHTWALPLSMKTKRWHRPFKFDSDGSYDGISGNYGVKWNPNWDAREPMLNMTSKPAKDSVFELNCVDCNANINLEAIWELDVDVKALGSPKLAKSRSLQALLKSVVSQASNSLMAVEETHLRTQVELLSTGGGDLWCNIPGTCGFGYQAGMLQLKDSGELDDKTTNPKFKYPSNSGGRDLSGSGSFPKGMGPLKFAAPDIGAGFWADVKMLGNANITVPSVHITIPKGQGMTIDLIRPKFFESSFDPIIEVGANFGITSKLFEGHNAKLGARYDFLRFNFNAKEKQWVEEGFDCEFGADDDYLPNALSLSLEVSTGLMAYFNAAKLYFNTGQLHFPLYKTWKLWEYCVKCPGNQCLSSTLNDAIAKVENEMFGDRLPMKKTVKELGGEFLNSHATTFGKFGEELDV